MSPDIAIAAFPENGCTVQAVSRVQPMQRVTTDKRIPATADTTLLALRGVNPVRRMQPARGHQQLPADPVIIDPITINVLLALQMRLVQVQVLPVTPDIKKKVILALKAVRTVAPSVTDRPVKNANPTNSFTAISVLTAIQVQ